MANPENPGQAPIPEDEPSPDGQKDTKYQGAEQDTEGFQEDTKYQG